MTDLKKHIELVAHMQKKSATTPLHEVKTRAYETAGHKEIVIKMGRSTLFFIMVTQLLIVALFFVLGFTVAWNYFSQTTPASFAQPTTSLHNQIVNDIAELSPTSSSSPNRHG